MNPTSDDFETWLVYMDLALERFMDGLPIDLMRQLDFSGQSLEHLEAWILAKYGSSQSMRDRAEAPVVDALGRYIGETFRKEIGGRWEVRHDDPNYVFYGLPQLTGFWDNPTPVCPMALATAAADRRTGKFLSGVLANYIRQKTTRVKRSQ
jgi:hypothetical protein